MFVPMDAVVKRLPRFVLFAVAAFGLWAAAACGQEAGDGSERASSGSDTLTVRGIVTTIGNEPFTRQRLILGPDSAFVLTFPPDTAITTSETGPTRVTVRGRAYRDTWQGREMNHLEVYSWTGAN